MDNFFRVVRLALRYRFNVFASVASALAVAVLWGGNISAVYPIVEVTFRNKSMQQWATEKIAEADATALRLGKSIASLDRKIAAAPAASLAELKDQRSRLNSRRDAEREAAANYRAWKPYIDRYLPQDPFTTVALVVGLLVLGTAVKSVFAIINTMYSSKLAQLASFDLRKLFYRRTLRMELASFSNEGTGELMSRFTYDVENVMEGVTSLFGKAIREPLKMLACFIGAAWICWRLLLLSMIVAPIAFLLIDRLAKLLKRANRRAMEEMSQIYSLLEETFQGIKVVKAFTMERTERARFHRGSKKYFFRGLKIIGYESLTRPVTEMMGILIISLALLAGAYLVLKGETHLLGIRMSDRPISLGALLVFYGLLAGTSDPARKLSEIFSRVQRAAAASDRVFALLDREPTISDPPNPKPLPRHCGEIRLEGVRFQYNSNVPVLQDINLTIPFGETLAIVGHNGCGKSTLANLLPRFYDPQAGRVLWDGVDVRDAKLRDLRTQIGIVTQETLLFDDTVMNNIRYGSPGATSEAVIAAAKQAHAHEFILERLEHGYESSVGPRGGLLSGGQRQRIALARAILRDPALLILDEATSQVDLESEQLIQQVLEEFTRNRTTVIITHRLSTLALADRILVMESGRISDLGAHRELLSRCELYRRLHDIGFKAADEMREAA